MLELFVMRAALAGMAARHSQDFHATIARRSRHPTLIDLLCGELYALLRLYRRVAAACGCGRSAARMRREKALAQAAGTR